jgi:hypothetical protein
MVRWPAGSGLPSTFLGFAAPLPTHRLPFFAAASGLQAAVWFDWYFSIGGGWVFIRDLRGSRSCKEAVVLKILVGWDQLASSAGPP